jgi:hypothetical protein
MDDPTGPELASFALPLASYDSLAWLERFRRKVNDEVRAQALAAFMPAFEERYARLKSMPPPDQISRIGRGDRLLSQVQEAGCALASLARAHRRRIRELTVPIADGMRASLDSVAQPRFEDGHLRLPIEAHGELYEAVAAGLEDCGAMDALGAYAGEPLRLNSLGLQVNTALETRAKYGELDAAGLPERATSYFHVDSNDWPTVKALIYLSDVGPDQGPFRYVAGSQRLMAPFEAAVRKTNDKMKVTTVALCALPQKYAQHANFGDYIDPTTPGARRLLDQEMVVCDGGSDLILFDNNGVHRGGMVREGARYLLQCMFVRASRAMRSDR